MHKAEMVVETNVLHVDKLPHINILDRNNKQKKILVVKT